MERRILLGARLGTGLVIGLLLLGTGLADGGSVRFGETTRTANGAIEAGQTDRAIREALSGDVATDRAALDRALAGPDQLAAGLRVLSRSDDGDYNVSYRGVQRCIRFGAGAPTLGDACAARST